MPFRTRPGPARPCPPTEKEGLVKQAEEESFVDLIACERDCRACSYAAALDCDGNCGVCPQRLCPCVNPVVARSKSALRLIELRPILSRTSRPGTKWTHPPSGTWSSGSGRPRGVFDLRRKESRLAELEARTTEPGFWDDQRAAQKVLREADGLSSRDRAVARPEPAPTTSLPLSSSSRSRATPN